MDTKKIDLKHIVLTSDNLSYLVKLLKEHDKNLTRLASFYGCAERDRIETILNVLES